MRPSDGRETTAPEKPRRLRLGPAAGSVSPLLLSSEATRHLLDQAETAMSSYLPVLAGCTASLWPLLLDSPLVNTQRFDPSSLSTLLYRGWLMDLAVGAAVLDRGLVVPEAGGVELRLDSETAHLSRLAFGLNVCSLPEAELTVGELWLGWPPGPGWWPPSRVLEILAGWLKPDVSQAPPALDSEGSLLLRHYGFVKGQPPELTLPLIKAGCPDMEPLLRALVKAGRRLAEEAAVPPLIGLPPDTTRLVFMRLLLEVASLRATEAGLVPPPSASDVRRWVWLGPLPPGTERWDAGGL